MAAREIHIRLCWVPAHRGVEGNERAHKAAQATVRNIRLATKGPSIYANCLKVLKSALFRDARIRIRNLANQDHMDSETGQFTRNLDKALPRPHAARIYDQLDFNDAHILAQLRTSHAHLNKYLAILKVAETSACPCGHSIEDVKHFLFTCPQWAEGRHDLIRQAGERWGDLSYLLGGWSDWVDNRTGKGKDGDRDLWKPNIKLIRKVIEFANGTGRLRGGRPGNLPTPQSTQQSLASNQGRSS